MFALLNFICPEIFVDYADLDSFLHKDENYTEADEEKSKKVVDALHKILRPFLLRRVKSDVEKSLLPSAFFNISNLIWNSSLFFRASQKKISTFMLG